MKALGYPYDKGVESHLARTKALLSTLSALKRLPNEMRNNFTQAIKCLDQNSIEIKKSNIRREILEKEQYASFIPIDGEAS